MKKMNKKGFSLIELLVALAIAGIIAAIAIPSYQSQIRKTRRADIKSALTRIATLEEQYYARKNQYTNNFDDLFGAATGTYGTSYTTENGGYYTLAITLNTVNTAGDSYSASGSPNAAGGQNKDTNCLTFTIDNFGAKKAYKSTSTMDSTTDTTSLCW